jgi:hypothetical protein
VSISQSRGFRAGGKPPLQVARKLLCGSAGQPNRKENSVRYRGFADTQPECPKAFAVEADTQPGWDCDIVEGRNIDEDALILGIQIMMDREVYRDDELIWDEWATALRQVD